MRYEIQVREYGRTYVTVGNDSSRQMGEQHVRILSTVVGNMVKQVRLWDNNSYDAPELLVFERNDVTNEFKRSF